MPETPEEYTATQQSHPADQADTAQPGPANHPFTSPASQPDPAIQQPDQPTSPGHGGARKGAGRKPKPPREKLFPLSFTVADPERQEIIEAAVLAGYSSISEYLRDLVLEAIKTKATRPK